MATNKPSAVANKASEIAGATTVRFVSPAAAIALKLRIMPQTVPNSPTNGAVEAMEAKKATPWLRTDISLISTEVVAFSSWFFKWVGVGTEPLAPDKMDGISLTAALKAKAKGSLGF